MMQRRKRVCPAKVNTEGSDRTKQQFILQIRSKIGQILHQERATKGTRKGLSLGDKFRNIGETGVRPNKGHFPGDCLELPNTLSCGQRNQKQHHFGEVPERAKVERLKERSFETPQGQIPCWRVRRARRSFRLKRANQIPENRIQRDRREPEAEDSRQHGAITKKRGDRQALQAAQPEEKIRDLRKGRTRDGMSLRATPTSVHRPLKLVVGPRRRATSQARPSCLSGGESLSPGKSLESLQA